jgi:CheY-like chemotaxis protein
LARGLRFSLVMTVATSASPAHSSTLRILLVDDDPEARRVLASMLARRGHAVTCAEEVEEAGAILEHRDYDLLCVDLDLAGLAGLEGLDLIAEARARRPGLRVLVETGNADPAVHRACVDRGAAGVYVKGRSLAELYRLLDAALALEAAS